MGGEDESRTIVVIGAGPTGLGAATRLNQHGIVDWVLIEAKSKAGGLATSEETAEGFTFDMGGHVIFSHYAYFDELLDAAVGTGEEFWNSHQRVSYIRMKERWIEYPFQNNLYNLPVEEQIKCIDGLVDAITLYRDTKPITFDEWILKVMGEGIADIFMRPYNFKVWAFPTTDMQCGWLGERVSTVDTKKVVANVLKKQPDGNWGPNAIFRFPKQGGTGGIWQKVAALLPQEKIRYKTRVVKLDAENKILSLDDGSSLKYDKLITTVPLDATLGMVGQATDGLHYSKVHIVGVGFRGRNPHDTKCWLYYPEDNCPFYRATVFSHYAEANVPPAEKKLKTMRLAGSAEPIDKEAEEGPYWSLMMEISSSEKKPIGSQQIIIEETIQGLINTTMCSAKDEIVSLYYTELRQGYPTPHLERDQRLNEALPYLKSRDIWSRGRFGSWKYEVGNQDHSLMLGVEAADNALFGTPEMTLRYPNQVNAQKNMDPHYTTSVRNNRI